MKTKREEAKTPKMKDIKIDVDFKDTCIDFGKYVLDHFKTMIMEQKPSLTIDKLWEEYQDNMNKEVRDILTDEGNGIGEPIMGSLENVNRYNDYYINTPERFPLSYEEWYLLNKDNKPESKEINAGDIHYSEEVFGKHFGSTQEKINNICAKLCDELGYDGYDYNHLLKEAAIKYKDTIKEAEPTQKEIEVNKYGELLKDFMEPYIEPNSKGNDTIEVANSELEDFYYSLGWRVRRWVKVAIERNVSNMEQNNSECNTDDTLPQIKCYCGHTINCDCAPEIIENEKVVNTDDTTTGNITSVPRLDTTAGDISSTTNADSDNVTYGNMGGIPRDALNPDLIDTFDKLDKMFDKPNQTETKPMNMTAEEFYKDHFGHTSQHVSMDKIFVCMELYARHQKVVQEEFDSNHKFSKYDESKPISGNKYYCGHTTPCDCEPETKQK